jgi:EAL domain-containing protein (putative c-di-GMP-specific phosphodiesterase class I)/CRP-like cAMP-binding protein
MNQFSFSDVNLPSANAQELDPWIFNPASSGDSIQAVLENESNCNLRVFAAGEIIFTEGDVSDHAYIIESGCVEIFIGSSDNAIQLSVLGPGNIFGEMGLIDASPRSASARAISECRCVVISNTQIAERIATSSPIVQLLISIFLYRNRAYNNYLENHLALPQIELSQCHLANQSNSDCPGHQKALESMKLESDLKNAVGRGELLLYYQPLLDLHHGELVGFEALLRWHSPQRGLIPPNQFIDLAEETSLIVPLGEWILEQAFTDLCQFQTAHRNTNGTANPLVMSINIAVRQFQEPNFFDRLLTLAQTYNIAPQHIKLEVTERIFLENAEAIQVISQCRAAGFEISLDDFGTGYSSLSYLERCEIDSLKIDQSFIQKLCTSERAKVLVGSIISISRGLGLPTIAEGVETPEQMSALQELGCEIGQGYLFGKPVTFAQALGWVNKNNPNHPNTHLSDSDQACWAVNRLMPWETSDRKNSVR